MRSKTVITSNIAKFLHALKTLETRGIGEEGMGILSGLPGDGKSTAIAYVVNKKGGVYLRASVTWTVTSMLRTLMHEIKGEEGRTRFGMIEQAIKELCENPRPIFIDEADYLFRQTDMLDALRDIYDSARVPVMLIGMEDIERKMRTNPKFNRFKRRITQWVRFEGLNAQDAQLVADELCDVAVGADLINRLHRETSGNIGNIVIGLGRIERFAKANSLSSVSLEEYADQPLN